MRDFLQDEFFIKLVNNPDEDTRHYWQRWLEKHPERKKEFELARQTIQSIRYKKTKKLSESDYNRMFLKIRAFKQLQDEIESNTAFIKKRKHYPNILRVAAVILFFVTISFGIVYLSSEHKYDQVTSYEEIIEINVPYGAKKTIRLADGSTIRLNAGSRFVFPKQFKNTVRTVELKGEAYFEVARDENRPFIIKTGDINTYVLGTSFNLRHYEAEEFIEVALVSGNVKVIDVQGNETLLNPLDAAIYSKDTKTITTQGFDARLVTSWKDNILLFEKATIPQIVQRLENWYGVKITIDLDNPIIGLYSGEYRDESLEMVLDGIGYTSGFQYSIDGNYITIKN